MNTKLNELKTILKENDTLKRIGKFAKFLNENEDIAINLQFATLLKKAKAGIEIEVA